MSVAPRFPFHDRCVLCTAADSCVSFCVPWGGSGAGPSSAVVSLCAACSEAATRDASLARASVGFASPPEAVNPMYVLLSARLGSPTEASSVAHFDPRAFGRVATRAARCLAVVEFGQLFSSRRPLETRCLNRLAEMRAVLEMSPGLEPGALRCDINFRYFRSPASPHSSGARWLLEFYGAIWYLVEAG